VEPTARRRLGRPHVEVDHLDLGMVPLGNLCTAVSEPVLQAWWDADSRTFDVAPVYRCGIAEERLACFLREKPGTPGWSPRRSGGGCASAPRDLEPFWPTISLGGSTP
jgi:hypothetical protein